MADLTGMMQAAAGAGGGGGIPYIEDVFSTWLYTGNDSTQTINNGIDLAGEGGLVWIKARSGPFASSSEFGRHILIDTVRGSNKVLSSSTSSAEETSTAYISSFNSSGFSVGGATAVNDGSSNFASWTFRKQPKFFDVVTYTGTGVARTIAHNLGSVPGCIIVKRTDDTGDWQVYHRANTANPETDYLVLNDTAATADSDTRWNDTQPTDAVFSLGTEATVNASGGTYIAYIWAHDAGGFGLTGTDNVISCGAYTTPASGNAVINLGYEPQWVMIKRSDGVANWELHDVMRGFSQETFSRLYPNLSDAEQNLTGNYIFPTATGFEITSSSYVASATYIYIAIRRGPMAVPTTGTSVFAPVTYSGNGSTQTIVNNLNVATGSLVWLKGRNNGNGHGLMDSLRGGSRKLSSSVDTAENAEGDISSFNNSGFSLNYVGGPGGNNAGGGDTFVSWTFRRAPSFFDEVCYTGTGSATTFSHNLQAVPELMIVKDRTSARDWLVYNATIGNTNTLYLNATLGSSSSSGWNSTTPTSSVFSLSSLDVVNASGNSYVAYLFATCAGVSKVGSYTGNGSSQTINCGFTGGARFILIKRTDSTGDWYVWDSARGIIAGDDPYLRPNSGAAEVTGTDYIDTAATGFELTSTAPAAINASGGTYIFLAIA
jgi:hypothetical protein